MGGTPRKIPRLRVVGGRTLEGVVHLEGFVFSPGALIRRGSRFGIFFFLTESSLSLDYFLCKPSSIERNPEHDWQKVFGFL